LFLTKKYFLKENLLMNNLVFNKNYFVLFLLLFVTEVLIALYFHDNFIRPYFGDFLVVLLIYCFGMSFLNCNKYKMAIAVLIFAFMVEFAQYFNVVEQLNLQNSTIAKVVIGTSFSCHDLIIYVLAFLFIIGFEYVLAKKKS